MGSTLALVNSSGGVTAGYSYAPFGKTTIAGTSSTTFQFTGRENDSTGLYYYRNRYYSPTYQKFISQDPIGFAGADTNLYAYVRNNPVLFLDALGLAWNDWQYVIASVEGTTAQNPNLSSVTAYGFNTNTGVFAALPARVAEGSEVEIKANGQTLDVPVGDVGPFNANDPYWLNNTIPASELGVSISGMGTSGAAIDLSSALAEQFGIQGNTWVRWRGLNACFGHESILP